MLDLRLFGTADLQLEDGGSALPVLAQPKRLAILVYLALVHPRGFQRRDTLTALFWPEADTVHARHALSQALYHLRHCLGETAILNRNDEEVGLDWSRWRCDAVAFRADLGAGRLEQALSRYEGDLLAGFHADASPEFEQWLDEQRCQARHAALDAALELAARAEYARRWEEAEHWLRQATTIEPLDEAPVQRCMALLHRAGDSAAALAVYTSFAARLAVELGTLPSPALRNVADQIRASLAAATPVLPARVAQRVDHDVPHIYERLGEWYAQRGETQQAVACYRRLLRLWEHGDEELHPRVRHARERIAILEASRDG